MAEKFLNTKYVKILKVIISIGIIFTIVMMVYFPNYAKLKHLKEENQKLILNNEQLEKEIVDYALKIQKIEQGRDPYIYEKIARDDLGVAKDNEIVIDIGQ